MGTEADITDMPPSYSVTSRSIVMSSTPSRASLRHLQDLLCDKINLLDMLARELVASSEMNNSYSTRGPSSGKGVLGVVL